MPLHVMIECAEFFSEIELFHKVFANTKNSGLNIKEYFIKRKQ